METPRWRIPHSPGRRPRCWPTARRRPADHAEDDKGASPRQRADRSQADGRYSSASLLRRSRKSAAQRSVSIAYAETRVITNFVDRPE